MFLQSFCLKEAPKHFALRAQAFTALTAASPLSPTRYASKAEKGSTASANLLNASLSRMKDRDDGESATGVLTSFLAQQVGGRDWSAQEVAHVNMGWRTVWASHEFDHVTMGTQRRVRTKVDSATPDHYSATDPNKWDLYLKRCDQFAEQIKGQPPMTRFVDQASSGMNVNDVDPAHIQSCSFTEFWRRYHYVSNGRKGGRKIQLRVDPTIILVKPRMPRQWGKRGHPKRIDYCRVRLQSHKPFKCRDEYVEYVYKQHMGDFEAAYEDFVLHDRDAPACCKDDFREFHIEQDGEQVNDPNDNPRLHEDFAGISQINPQYAAASSRMETSNVDWGARSARTYSADLIASAARWRSSVAQSAQPPKPVYVDPSKLNEGQAFVYRVVAEHHEKRQRGPVAPLRMLICGTAGSGKTFLIRALKQHLGDACRVLAPTGVAADNIGKLALAAAALAAAALAAAALAAAALATALATAALAALSATPLADSRSPPCAPIHRRLYLPFNGATPENEHGPR